MKNVMKNFSNRLFKHELINGSFYVILIANFSSIFSFLFNLFLTRKLSYVDYGVYMSLIAFIGLITIPSQAITIPIIQYATGLFAMNNIAKVKRLYVISFQYISAISIGIMVVVLISLKYISLFLHIENPGYIILTSITIGLVYFNILNNAFLQSLIRFRLLSILSFLSVIVKCIFGIVLILAGFKVFGALWGYLLSIFIPILLSFIPLKFLIQHEKVEPINIPKKDLYSYMSATIVATVSLSSFISSDIILVKHFFSSYDAGLYSGLSLVGKVVFYISAPIPTIMFPVIIKKYNKGENFRNTFYLGLLLVFLPSILIAMIYYFFPGEMINLFLGGKGYLRLSSYLWLYALYIGIYSMLNICVSFFLSLKKTRILYVVGIGAITQILFIVLFHASFLQVIGISLLNNSILLIVILLYYLRNYGDKKGKKASYLINNTSI